MEFLIDTGASKTTLLDKDAIFLDLNYDDLKKHSQNVSGIGGSVETFIVDDSTLLLDSVEIRVPIFVLRHDIENLNKEERIRILRLPSLLGRDVINRFKLIFSRDKDEIIFED